jgi:hypothetical protein
MQRTHPLRQDLDWVPPRYHALRWTVTGGAVAATIAFAFATHLTGVIAPSVLGAFYAGDEAARRLLRVRLRSLAQGAVDVSRLPAEPDGQLVHVVGKVRVREPVQGLVSTEPAAFRRVQFNVSSMQLIHEAANDFWLVADGSEPILIETEHARWLAPMGKRTRVDGRLEEAIGSLPLPSRPRRVLEARTRWSELRKHVNRMLISEALLRDGDAIEVLGYKSRTIDATMTSRLERDTPYRATLRGGTKLPLLIALRRSV